MKKTLLTVLWTVLLLLTGTGIAAADAVLTAVPETARVGDVVDVTVTPGEGAAVVIYTLTRDGEAVFQGKEDPHFSASFRPRAEGEYTLSAAVRYEDGREETASVTVAVAGFAEEAQGADWIYSQKDGWWQDKAYAKTDLDNAGCAIFTLSHALQRIGWAGEDVRPENLAVTYKNCYTKNGTAVARLINNASKVYGYTIKRNLIHEKTEIRDGLINGDYYSFSIVIGHIALMAGLDEKAGKVLVVDSAPTATFERIKKGKIYELRDGAYTEVSDPGQISGARYYFETEGYGGLSYYMDLDYCAKRGGRLIRPTWLYYQGEQGRIGAEMVSLTSGESEITVSGKSLTVPTRTLSWGRPESCRMAYVNQKKAVRMLNAGGKRIGSVPSCAIVPVLGETEDLLQVIYDGNRGYVKASEVEMISPLEGDIRYGVISLNGNTSGRATVRMRYGPSEKERIVDNWKTGTKVLLLRQENEFWLVEGLGMRLWVSQEFVTPEA